MRRMVGTLVALACTAAPASAQEPRYAPADRPGPALTEPAAELEQALRCSGDLASRERTPVLLVHGTNLDPEANFDWNWARALDALGRPHCEVRLADRGMADIQASGERVVYAIREVHRRAGGDRRIDVLGYSQGGMVPRWALRFWPDTRALVDDLVGLAASNHGTANAEVLCAQGTCPASYHQQASGAQFIEALNSVQETFPGIDYTAVYTRFDQVVTPNLDATGSTSLRAAPGTSATNVALQDVCPANTADHLAIGSYDPVAYAIAIQALDAPGPADPARVDRAACSRLHQPGVDPATFARDYARMGQVIGEAGARAEQVRGEPPLRCYVMAACPAVAQPSTTGRPLRLTRRCEGGRRLRLTVTGSGIRAVEWRAGAKRLAADRTAPFRRVVRLPRRVRSTKLRAVVTTRAGRVRLSRTLPRCG